jgi:Flp pilus assembly protein TadG
MDIKRVADKLCSIARRFRAEQGGNVAITFVLALIPMVGFLGAAIDYSRAASARAALQSALDSAALMLSKEAPNLTTTQLTQKANDYFNAMFTRPEALNKQLTVTYDSTADTLTMDASAKVNTTFSRVVGYNQFAIGSSTTVKWGMSRLRVALALDTTGSMASAGKIAALKTATKSLLTMLQNSASKPGDVYVSIIPFSKDVNVGLVQRQCQLARLDRMGRQRAKWMVLLHLDGRRLVLEGRRPEAEEPSPGPCKLERVRDRSRHQYSSRRQSGA